MENLAPIPENESARIEKLRYYDILDTDAEEMFDDLTKLAAQILEVPICTISLIDEDRQWFKSKIGIEDKETSREISFCQYTIMEDDIFEVEDAVKDERFKDNPLVTGNPGIRFYSGAALRDEDGHAIGTLCAIDLVPRRFTQKQQMALKWISNTVLKLIQLRRDKNEMERLTVVKDEFISNMSHEIRTPLNAIIGFNDLLGKTPLNEEQSSFLKTINIATHNLKDIINDILDVSKLEGNKITLEENPISVSELVQHIIKLQSPNAKAKSIKLFSVIDHELPKYVLGDETRLVQILNNLVSNALKFTHEGHVEIRVVVNSKRLGSTSILFEVKDTGIGIPAEKKQKIFERFEQAETRTTRLYGGTGLGLSIVKKLVNLHNSEILLESEEGQGSLFSFEIDFKECEQNQVETDLSKIQLSEDLLRNQKILLVEDNFHNQLLAKSYFKRWGAEIAIAENGEIALEALLKKDFDIILMDLQMPVMNGFMTTDKIRNELKLDIPIIGCSANSKSSEQKKCLEIGMNDYITKPYSEDVLIQTTCKHLNIASMVQDKITEGVSSNFDNFSIILTYLKSSFGDEVFNEAQNHFLTRTPADIDEIKSAIVNRDMEFLQNKAHFIAGTLGALKFNIGCEIAKKLEKTAKLGQNKKSLVLAEELIGHLKNAMNCFSKEIAA
ncbi:MAG: ATP-binding protein [Maribacter sp.]